MDYKKFIRDIAFTARAHQENLLPTAKAFRMCSGGGKNAYFTHPLWCAMMILLDSRLPENVRAVGAEALLFHDLMEDTSSGLPEDVSDEVRNLVNDMTYQNWESERILASTKSPFVQLLKLYDKVATLYDEYAPEGDKLREWLELTKNLTQTVRKE